MYKVEPYIERCLTSCINQDISESEYEIICVNDGSPDNSATIARKIAEKHSNIKVVDRSNGGLSEARNTGLSIAKGDYVWFVDSDDWIKENCLKKIVTKCFDCRLDILRICAADVSEGNFKRRFSTTEGTISKGVDILRKGVPPCAPFSIYRRNFLYKHELRFYPGIFHEDNEFTPRVFYLAERVSAINDVAYFVYQSPGSITRSVNVKKPLDVTIVMCSLDAFYQKYVSNDSKDIFHHIIAACMNSALHQTLVFNKADCHLVNTSFYEIRHLFMHARKSPSWQYRLAGRLYTLFPHHVVEVYHLLHFKL